MKNLLVRMTFGLAALILAPAFAHEVHHTVETGGAVIVKLTYADGKPFAYEAYEATPEGADVPAQVGRTDAQGRAVFIADDVKKWRVKAYSADGHGVTLNFDAPATAAATPSAGSESPSRASLLLFGLSLLLGGFGIYQLWLIKKQK